MPLAPAQARTHAGTHASTHALLSPRPPPTPVTTSEAAPRQIYVFSALALEPDRWDTWAGLVGRLGRERARERDGGRDKEAEQGRVAPHLSPHLRSSPLPRPALSPQLLTP